MIIEVLQLCSVESDLFSSLSVLIRQLAWWSEPEVPHFPFLTGSNVTR